MQKRLLCTAILACASIVFPQAGQAAKKLGNQKIERDYQLVEQDDLFDAQVSIKIPSANKKKKKGESSSVFSIQCLENTPGKTVLREDGLAFLSYALEANYFNKQRKQKTKQLLRKGKNPRSNAAVKSLTSKAKLAQAIANAGRSKCVRPAFRSFEAYNGSFGIEEARTICERFMYGCSEAELQQAVAEGLNSFVNRITTYVEDGWLNGTSNDLICDGRLSTNRDGSPNEDNESCDSHNPNDLYMPGVRYAWYYRTLYTPNRYFDRVALFLHQERASVNTSVLNSCERHAVLPYIDLVRRAARTGDLRQYCADFTKDHFGAIRYLNLDTSSYIGTPNEDFAREILELLCMSPTDLDGNPWYGTQD
ncbi:MAG: DUF1800 family protein, partial [Bdellovibrionales bacterium]|nr:DUF1800 family protein [Bdellovibrionales bacterium]